MVEDEEPVCVLIDFIVHLDVLVFEFVDEKVASGTAAGGTGKVAVVERSDPL